MEVDSFNHELVPGVYEPLDRQLREDLCWLHSVADNVEVFFWLVHGERIKIAKQEMLDKCNPGVEIGNSYLFNETSAFRWIATHGVCLEMNYPNQWTGVRQHPAERPQNARIVKISEPVVLLGGQETEILQVLKRNPVVAAMTLVSHIYRSVKDCPIYPYSIKGDAIDDDDDDHVQHAVNLTGWKSSNTSNDYFVRDNMENDAPNEGHYKVVRYSSVGDDDFNPIRRVVYTENIYTVIIGGSD